jgi:hypothetical protein
MAHSEEKTKAKTGRRRKNVDPSGVRKLASFGCTNSEISAFFDCSNDTIERRFAVDLAKGREEGKIRLRKLQWKHAEKSFAMAIFLGKNILKQSDKQEIDHTGDVNVNIGTARVSDLKGEITTLFRDETIRKELLALLAAAGGNGHAKSAP